MKRPYNLMLVWLLATPTVVQAQVQPGQWESSVTVNAIEIPGAPPQVAEMMKSQMGGGKQTRTSYCITPEQAEQGPREMLKQNPSCRFTKYSMKNGSISTEMSCSQNGGTMTVRSNGTYTADSFELTSNAAMAGVMAMRMSSTSTGRRIGPCASGR